VTLSISALATTLNRWRFVTIDGVTEKGGRFSHIPFWLNGNFFSKYDT
jgi:hypothetical protein